MDLPVSLAFVRLDLPKSERFERDDVAHNPGGASVRKTPGNLPERFGEGRFE